MLRYCSVMATDPFYQSTEWRELRRAVIRTHPGCATAGCVGKSSHVDHIVSRRRGGASLDPANLQALCHPAIRRRRPASMAGSAAPVRAPVRATGCDASGRPFDPGQATGMGKP